MASPQCLLVAEAGAELLVRPLQELGRRVEAQILIGERRHLALDVDLFGRQTVRRAGGVGNRETATARTRRRPRHAIGDRTRALRAHVELLAERVGLGGTTEDAEQHWGEGCCALGGGNSVAVLARPGPDKEMTLFR